MKKHLKLLLGGLLLAMALAILPTIKTDAATTIKTLTQDGKWVKTDKYYVKWADNGYLYYKVGSSGTSQKIDTGVQCASVNGTTLAYIKNAKSYIDVYTYGLTTKVRKKIYSKEASPDSEYGTDEYSAADVAIYGPYCYASFMHGYSFYNQDEEILTYKIHMSTKKTARVSSLCNNRFYQNGTKLICLDMNRKLRIYDFSQLKFTKTICSNTKAFAIVGSKLHYVKFTPKVANRCTSYTKDYDFEVKICSLTGSVYERYPIKEFANRQNKLMYGRIAFAGSAVYLIDWVTEGEDMFDKYSYKTDTWTDSTEATFNTLCKRYYTVANYTFY